MNTPVPDCSEYSPEAATQFQLKFRDFPWICRNDGAEGKPCGQCPARKFAGRGPGLKFAAGKISPY